MPVVPREVPEEEERRIVAKFTAGVGIKRLAVVHRIGGERVKSILAAHGVWVNHNVVEVAKTNGDIAFAKAMRGLTYRGAGGKRHGSN